MLAAKLTSKYQATIPDPVRKKLGLQKGDVIAFEIQKDEVTLKKASPLDLKFAKSLEGTLEEWGSRYDDEAYGDL